MFRGKAKELFTIDFNLFPSKQALLSVSVKNLRNWALSGYNLMVLFFGLLAM